VTTIDRALVKENARVTLLRALGNSDLQAVASVARLEAEKSDLQVALNGWTFPK
jgi:hypothetical protein